MNDIPSKQYKTICKPAFSKNDETHKEMSDKLDVLLDRTAGVRGQLKGVWWIFGGLGAIIAFMGRMLWVHILGGK